ncbi:MAG: FAD-dependent oxidoreductase [Lachnospirales bacterium]
MSYKNLLSPLEIRGNILKNRMECSNSLPHFLQGPETYPSESVITHYANKAKNGAAIVTCMGINNFSRGLKMESEVPISHFPDYETDGDKKAEAVKEITNIMEFDIAHFPDYDLYDPTSQNYLIQLADAIHYHDSIACMGFFVGPQSAYPLIDGDKLKFVSANKKVDSYTKEEISLICDSYAEQAKVLKFLGFDMVSVHFAYRGQLPSRFMSPITNNRTDEYGGSSENRFRFAKEIIERIREVCGPKFIIECLMSTHEDGGYDIDETVEFLKSVGDSLDIVQLRAKDVDEAHPTGFNLEATPFLNDSKYIRDRVEGKVLISTIGGYHDPDVNEKAIAEGYADIIGMARSFMSNPEYGKLIYDNKTDDIVPCVRCNKCHGRGKDDVFASVCTVNPKIGIEHRLDVLTSEPKVKHNVAVIGGGPCGMKVAIELFDRGHSVTLYEGTDELGGMLKHTNFVDFKWPVKDYKNFLIKQVEKRDIKLYLNTKVTSESLASESFDVIIPALGATPIRPNIKGADGENVHFAIDVFEKPEAIGDKVVVIGGGEVGVETGMFFAKMGKEVTVIEMRDELAPDTTLMHYKEAFKEAWEAIPTFKSVVNARCSEISDKEVKYLDENNNEHSIEANSVILSVGMKPRNSEALEFYGKADYFYMIGDCKAPRTIQQVTREAFATASRI